jgi:hypothetical protein
MQAMSLQPDSITPLPGISSTEVELTLQPPRWASLRDATDALTPVSVEYVRRVRVLGDTIEGRAHPTYRFEKDDAVEKIRIAQDAAGRLLETFTQSQARGYEDNLRLSDRWAFAYIAGVRKNPRTPAWANRRTQIVDLEGAADGPLVPLSFYSVSRGIGTTVLKTFLTLGNPERSLAMSQSSIFVARTTDLARLGAHVTPARIPS